MDPLYKEKDIGDWGCGRSMTGVGCYMNDGGPIGICCRATDGFNKECLGVKIGGVNACSGGKEL